MPRPSVPAPVRTALRLAGLLAVLAGLFGMHGLASHGGAGMESMPHGVIAATSEVTAPAVAATPAHAVDALASGLDTGHGVAAALIGPVIPDGIDLDMAGLCIALLAMGLGALVWLRRIGHGALVLWVQPRVTTATTVSGLRHPAPPSLTLLSIQRC